MVRAVVVRLQEERSLCPVVVAEQAAPAVEAPADLVVLAVAEQAAARLVTETSLGTEAVDSGMEESPVVGGVALLPRLELRCGQGREALDAADSDRHLDGRGDVVGRTE